MSRVLAAKAALAIRCDALGDATTPNIGVEARERLEMRLRTMEGRPPMASEGIQGEQDGSGGALLVKGVDSFLGVDNGPKAYVAPSDVGTYNDSDDALLSAKKKKKKKRKRDADADPMEVDVEDDARAKKKKKKKKSKKAEAAAMDVDEEEPQKKSKKSKKSKKKKSKKSDTE